MLMAALRAGRRVAASVLLRASAVPTEAAHTFRYAWVIAAALRVSAWDIKVSRAIFSALSIGDFKMITGKRDIPSMGFRAVLNSGN